MFIKEKGEEEIIFTYTKQTKNKHIMSNNVSGSPPPTSVTIRKM